MFPDGDFENTGISYRPIGDARGTVAMDSEIRHGGSRALKVENTSGGNFRAYSGQVISLEQTAPKPIKVSYMCRRHGIGKTLAAIDIVFVDADGKRFYWFDGLKIDADTGGKWIRREAVYTPSRPIRSMEVWPIVNGEPCTVWFDDVAVLTDVAASAASGRTFDVSRGNVKLSFLESDGRLSLSSLNLFSCDFIRKSKIRKAKNLWRVSFRLPDTRCVSVDSGHLDSMERAGDNLWMLHWKDLEIPSSGSHFSVDVIVKLREEGAEWKINIEGGEEILSVAFPCISGIGPLGEDGTDDFLALPKNNGILLRDYSTVGTENLTYGAGASMQCTAFYDKSGGLYLSSNDSGMHAKLYSVSRQLDNSLAYSLETVPSGSIKGRRRYEQPFAFEMLFFVGDWFDAAMLYRRSFKQPWCKGGKLSERLNPALFDCDVWVKGGGVDEERYAYSEKSTAAIAKLTPDERLKLAGKISAHGSGDRLVAIREAVKPAGVGIFFSDNWHCFGCLGICAGNPEYQARRGFAELVSMMNNNGIWLLPYTNFGRWDVLMKGYDERIMIRRADMSILKHPAHGTEQAAVCHGTAAAEALWRSMAKQISGYGCSGIYLDELSTNGNPVCYSEEHDHAPGDGSAKIRAQRNNVLAIKDAVKDVNPHFFTMGEQGCETYIGANDVNMWWLVSQGDRDIPFFEAVYHDYSVSMCRIPGKWYGAHVERGYQDKSGEAGLEELALAIGKCFVHGQQIGLFRDDFVAYSKHGTSMLAEAAKLRRKLHPYLLFGTMQRAPEVIYPMAKVPVRQGFAGFTTTPSTSILTGSFEAEDGSMANLFFNITDKPQKVFWRIPSDSWKLPGCLSLALLTATEEKRTLGVVPVKELNKRTFELSLPPFGCAAVILSGTDEKPTEGFGFSVPPESGLSVNATPRSATIKAGDIVFIDLMLSNPSNSDVEFSMDWTLPNGWKLQDAPKGLKVPSGAEKRLVVSIDSAATSVGTVELGLEIADGGDWRKSFGWRLEVASPRRRLSVRPATAKRIESMRRCEALPEGERILLGQPRRRYAALDGIAVDGRAVYDSKGLYFLFKVDGVAKPVKAMHSDYMWNGCCMQMAFNGLRLNQPYAISLCMADTGEGSAVYDFMGCEMLKNPDFNFRSVGNSLFYFFGLSWGELGFEAPPIGKRVSFSATYNHNDGEKFAGYLEWTPGICGGTNPNEYGDLFVVK